MTPYHRYEVIGLIVAQTTDREKECSFCWRNQDNMKTHLGAYQV